MNKRFFIIPILLVVTAVAFVAAFGKGWIANRKPADEKKLPDAKEELMKIVALYTKEDSIISMHGTIKLLDEEKNYALTETSFFDYQRNGNEVYSRLGPLFTYITDSLFVQVDTADKYITAGIKNNMQVPAGIGTHNSVIAVLEKLMNDSSYSIQLSITESGGERILHIENEMQPEIKSSRIVYNPYSYSIIRTETEWWKNGYNTGNDEKKCWYTEARFDASKKPPVDIEDELKKIIQVHHGELAVAPAYLKYELKKIAE